jgi:hypothetical protein
MFIKRFRDFAILLYSLNKRIELMRKSIAKVVIFLLMSILLPSSAFAATACSTVKIEIAQELTLERIAFDAKLPNSVR